MASKGRFKKGQKAINPFKKGHKTWNEGLKLSESHRGKLSESQKDQIAWNKGKKLTAKKKINQVIPRPKYGIENPEWRGDDVGYDALHRWVSRKLGKPKYCEHCKNTRLRHRQYHWANISKTYKRDVTDWKRLCVKCHASFDEGCGRGKRGKRKNY